jgi:hypothetical protein
MDVNIYVCRYKERSEVRGQIAEVKPGSQTASAVAGFSNLQSDLGLGRDYFDDYIECCGGYGG